ncbi:hypothetical protein D910_02248 [Dendroctonus ponderosae]|uniref:Coiled-coil domain-containing protein 181 n=2 Tax=Dendroctonus ponderosae TaxID=77166 RepID=U4TTI5_DENPD|nr:hypothetical protein D910_02248 [Dendroctonus ponderosae]KAH1013006.1 hypothetical protein HUJ05_012064 [Dendroctonus ponderosae]
MDERSNDENNHPYNTVINDSIDISDIDEEIDEAVVVEELVQSDEDEQIENNQKIQCIQKQQPIADNSKPTTKQLETPVKTKKRSKKRKLSHRAARLEEVHCKEHCIERIDTQLSISIKKLAIHEKPPVNLPPLQLHQRKCCDDIKLSSSDRNLPKYNGYRSEYGLTSRQIKNRNRYVEMMRQKQLSRQKLIEEYRALKLQQNEKVFCQWLREVSSRNKEQNMRNQNAKHGSQGVSPSYLSSSTLVVSKMGKPKQRPKTAEYVPKTHIKKAIRPHTTQSCVYIEVSPKLLNQGIHIGDLLITNSKKLSKKLHILTVS